MDKLKKMIYTNKSILVFLIGLLIIAVIFGSCLPLFLSDGDKTLMTNYLNNFVSNLGNGNVLSFLINGLCTNCGFAFIIWLLGISVIGIPIVLLMFFSKCFIIGFSVSSIIINYGFKGILFSLFYIFPHQVINIFVYGLLTSYSLIFSLRILLLLFKKGEFNINLAFKKYFKIFCFCFLILLACVLYETFISPIVLKFIFSLL